MAWVECRHCRAHLTAEDLASRSRCSACNTAFSTVEYSAARTVVYPTKKIATWVQVTAEVLRDGDPPQPVPEGGRCELMAVAYQMREEAA